MSQGKAVTIKGAVIEARVSPATQRQSPLPTAVPPEGAVTRLSDNTMALDPYAWLAQRLHRIHQAAFIPWPTLKILGHAATVKRAAG